MEVKPPTLQVLQTEKEKKAVGEVEPLKLGHNSVFRFLNLLF